MAAEPADLQHPICVACGERPATRSGRCIRCRRYLASHGHDRPAGTKRGLPARAAPPLCVVCGAGPWMARGRCRRCYGYWRRHGHDERPRPADVDPDDLDGLMAASDAAWEPVWLEAVLADLDLPAMPEAFEMARPAWQARAACVGRGDLPWVAAGPADSRCVAVCQGCPVACDCYRWAVDHGEVGVWAGTGDEERVRAR